MSTASPDFPPLVWALAVAVAAAQPAVAVGAVAVTAVAVAAVAVVAVRPTASPVTRLRCVGLLGLDEGLVFGLENSTRGPALAVTVWKLLPRRPVDTEDLETARGGAFQAHVLGALAPCPGLGLALGATLE